MVFQNFSIRKLIQVDILVENWLSVEVVNKSGMAAVYLWCFLQSKGSIAIAEQTNENNPSTIMWIFLCFIICFLCVFNKHATAMPATTDQKENQTVANYQEILQGAVLASAWTAGQDHWLRGGRAKSLDKGESVILSENQTRQLLGKMSQNGATGDCKSSVWPMQCRKVRRLCSQQRELCIQLQGSFMQREIYRPHKSNGPQKTRP